MAVGLLVLAHQLSPLVRLQAESPIVLVLLLASVCAFGTGRCARHHRRAGCCEERAEDKEEGGELHAAGR